MKTLLVASLALVALAAVCVAAQGSTKNVVITPGVEPLPKAPATYKKVTIITEEELRKYGPLHTEGGEHHHHRHHHGRHEHPEHCDKPHAAAPAVHPAVIVEPVAPIVPGHALPTPAPEHIEPTKPAEQHLDFNLNTTIPIEDEGDHYELNTTALAEKEKLNQDQELLTAIKIAYNESETFVPPPEPAAEAPVPAPSVPLPPVEAVTGHVPEADHAAVAAPATAAPAAEHVAAPVAAPAAHPAVAPAAAPVAPAAPHKSFTEVDSGVDMAAEAEAESEVMGACGSGGSCIARTACSTASHTIRTGLCPGSSSIICCQPKSTAVAHTTAPTSSSSSSSRVNKFLEAVRSKVGRPYKLGAAGPNSFDCSGLVNWAARQAGLTTLPRTADQLYHYGTAITNPSQRRPGDLIFFGKPGQRVYHVGVYVGGTNMIDAPHTGAFVRQENYSYWPDKLTTARRIF